MSHFQIKINDVSFTYNKHYIISHLSFAVRKGDYLGIIGPNGGGKTTLIKIILGLLKPTEGSVIVNGKCGYVPQRAAQDTAGLPATVEEVVASGGSSSEKVMQAMELTGIKKFHSRLISDLSGGERQKVFIAHSLAGDPEILILDEPSAGVDISSQGKFYSFLRKLNKKGITIIFVSHDINVIANEAKKVLCLGGKTVCFGTPQETITQKNIEDLYGRNVKFFLHQH